VLFLSTTPVYSQSNLKINEILAHPSTGNKEWAEFYNPENIDLSTYHLDDDTDFDSDAGSSSKKILSTYNNTNSSYPFFELSSFFNNGGDHVVLFDNSGQVVDQYEYVEDPGADTSLGRNPDGSGSFLALQNPTQGSPNSPPAPSPQIEEFKDEGNEEPENSNSNQKSPVASTQSKIVLTKSPSPSPKKSPKSVLGEQEKISPSPQNSPSQSTSPSPLQSPQTQNTPRAKVAAALTGSGAIIIGASFALFLWYSKRQGKKDAGS
jgi:hypothetical protein